MSFDERLERLRAEPAYRNYLRVRDEVVAMRARRSDTPSAYWQEELAGFEYMLDASPLIVEKLRHHTFHVTGLRVYEYRTGKSKQAAAAERKLAALRAAGDASLFVPEARELGGFGYEIDGALVNVDTLKFFEALLALDRAEELGRFRRGERLTVVEIGTGWGGFAYQLKTLFPETRYVLVDLPELFLFSATYLLTLFPDARVAFAPEAGAAAWDDADFVFVPNDAYATVPRPDLALNMVSFQEMTTEQVRTYAHWLADLDTPSVYSLNRDRSLYNDELTSVREILAERFWLEEPYVIPYTYVDEIKAGKSRPLPRPGVDDPAVDDPKRYRHVVARPRSGA